MGSTNWAKARRVCLWLSGLLLLVTVSLAIAITAPATGSADPEVARLAMCERDAGLVGQTLVNRGVDIRTTAWSQDRERAIQACKDNFPDLRWLLNGK